MLETLIRKIKKEEEGMFSIFAIFIMVCVLALAGLFINVAMGYLSINFSKKAMQESVRVRALATDIPVKENTGIIEVINYPYSGNNIPGFSRPSTDVVGQPISGVNSQEYKGAANYADLSAKSALIQSVETFIGNKMGGQQFVQIKQENICFDVRALPATEGNVTFTCALKGTDGKIYTLSTTTKVMGYNDVTNGKTINEFDDKTLNGNNTKVIASNVVFGAAIIEPRSFINTIMLSLGFDNHQSRTVIYSIAYPQIDKCYGSFC